MKEFSNTSKGMIKDLDIIGPDQYSHALNCVLEKFDSFPSNDYSNILGHVFLEGEDVIHTLLISEMSKRFFFTTKNRILEYSYQYDDSGFNTADTPLEYNNSVPIGSVKVVAESNCFNWSIENILSVEYKITDSTLNLYISDSKNEDKYLVLDVNGNDLSINEVFKEIISYDENNRPVYSDVINCDAIRWYPEVSYPTIETTQTEGGTLKAGVYQFFTAFATSKGIQLAGYKATSNPFHLFTKTLTEETDYDTGLAINVKISGFGEIGRYRFVNLGVVKTINGVTTYEMVRTLPISPVINYTYTGDSRAIPMDEVSVFQLFPFYESSKGVAKANNRLFKFGLKEYEKYNLQPIMDKFKLKWCTVSAKLGAYKRPEFAQKYKSNLRDEVVPYGMKFILDNGEETPLFTLIGRAMNIDDRLIIVNADANIQKDECSPPQIGVPKWKVYNTAYVTKTSNNAPSECNVVDYEEGEFAYWESTETYPNDPNVWGTHAGKPIRHFKMPDCLVSPHFTNVDGEPVIHPLGVKLDDSVNVSEVLQEAVNMGLITQKQKDRIRGYKIMRGNRAHNKSIIAKGLLFNTYQYTENNRQTLYSNYPFNDLRPDPYLSFESLKLQSTDWYKSPMYRNEFQNTSQYIFHSPETHFVQPALGTVLKSEMEVYGQASGFFNESKGQGTYVILNQLHYNFAILMGWLLTSELKLSEAQAATQGQTIGSTIGAVAGGVVGAFVGGVGAPLGAALGSALGGVIGKLVGGNTSSNDYNEMYRLSMWISQTDRILELIQNTTPLQNYHIQYQAVGKYFSQKKVENAGKKIRRIETSAYLNSTRQLLEDGTYFNNNLRESSVYLRLNDNIGVPTVQDNSRFVMSEKDCDMNLGEEILSNVSSFYTSIKRNVLNQYGDIFSIEWIPVSNTAWKLNQKFKEFGGDTFIGAEAFKIKQSMFSTTAYNLPDRTDIYYEDLNNIAYPRYFFNTRYTELREPASVELKVLNGLTNSMPLLASLNNIENPNAVTKNADLKNREIKPTQDGIAKLFERSLMNPYYILRPGRYSLDCEFDNFVEYPGDYVTVPTGSWWAKKVPLGIPNMRFNFTGVKGKIYTYVYGIPYYITESDINLDLRHATNPNEGNFYPNTNNLEFWLQPEDEYQPINFDNTYNYNRVYSKQNKEDLTFVNDVNFFKDKDKLMNLNRVIYSREGAEVENALFKDNFLYFNPVDSYDFEYSDGKLISLSTIESEQVLVRFENNLRIVNALQTIPVNGAVDATLGTGALFGGRPLQFSKTDNGYYGTQHRAILNTPFGHVFLDAKRGNVHLLGNGAKGIDDLSKNGMKNWFEKNLPFKILNHFPTADVDNAYNDLGIAMVYDDRFKRFFITKLDYVPKVSGIELIDNKWYLDGVQIQLTDGRYFCNASWTISYSFYTQTWRSFHSFTPNFYMEDLKTFISGLNGRGRGLSSAWIHNLTNKSFQTYYGKLRPFEIESVTKFSLSPQIQTSVGFKLDVVRNHNDEDQAYVDDVSFNKAEIYNERQHSGLVHLDMIDKNDLYSIKKYPIKDSDSSRALLFKNESQFDFNHFEDLSIDNNLPRYINSCNGVDRAINKATIQYGKRTVDNNYIRGDKTNIRLINDKTSKYRLIYKGLIDTFTPSVR